MTVYVEIEDLKEIRRLNDHLSKRLITALPRIETRIIGDPHGSYQVGVRFFSGSGKGVFYWTGFLSDDKQTASNLFGHGEPGARVPLYIDVQFNVPVVRFSRKSGGAFLRHIPSQKVVLAHRGIATLGHGRVSKTQLFEQMDATLQEAATGKGIDDFLLIGELESPSLIDDIDVFSSDLRQAVRTIKTVPASNGRKAPGGTVGNTNSISSKLRGYFDEFSGKRLLKGRGKTVADCYHGTVVRKIKDYFAGQGETLKSQAIDLTVILGKQVYLFEVKTSSDPQSIYTALGQLTAHAPIVAEYAPGKDLVRVMVVPELPNKRLCSLMKEKLGIRLLTYTRSANGRILFDDLDQLK
ncbi:MAG: hypothetical protein ABSG60_12545 [Terracidiphilus sp.]|jgi:hypothetical protein